jgi:hypothetical protein
LSTGDRWCTSFELDKDGADRMFAMVATRARATVAEGCATHRVDTSPLQVQIVATDLERKSDRRKPAVALGAYAIVGWEDRDPGHPGVYVRRFPSPTAM